MKPDEVQEDKAEKPWYKKVRHYLFFLALIVIFSGFGGENSNNVKQIQISTGSQPAAAIAGFSDVKANITKSKTAPKVNCHPSYSGRCLNPDTSDYDCAGGSGNGPYYTGKVRVVGYDAFGLDRDGDGWGCE